MSVPKLWLKIVSVVTHNALKCRALTIFTREGPKLLQFTGGGGGVAISPAISSPPLKGAPFNLINNFFLLLLKIFFGEP